MLIRQAKRLLDEEGEAAITTTTVGDAVYAPKIGMTMMRPLPSAPFMSVMNQKLNLKKATKRVK